MRMLNGPVAALLTLCLAQGAQCATVIHAGTLIDGVGSRAAGATTIVVSDGRITSVQRGHQPAAAEDALIDLTGHTVLPGLIDMHTHLTSRLARGSYVDRFRLNTADYTLRAVKNAGITLDAGFTTIRDLGDNGNVTVALRNAIARGDIRGPRILTAAKSIATTGGHADPTNGWNAAIAGDPGPKAGVINSVEDATKAVRQRYKDGADLIKITATGGVLSLAKSGQNPQFTEVEIAAVVAAARDYGFHVAAHAHGAEGMKRAIRAGVTTIEHGTYMDDEVMRLMKANNTWYVPTLLAGQWVRDKAREDGFFPDIVRPKAAQIGAALLETFGKAYRAGVPIVFGTDSGVSPHGINAQEFALMVDAGMAEMEAIQSATRIAAAVLELDDQLGTVEVGKHADLIAVRGNPLDDIRVLESVDFVMKGGTVEKDAR